MKNMGSYNYKTTCCVYNYDIVNHYCKDEIKYTLLDVGKNKLISYCEECMQAFHYNDLFDREEILLIGDELVAAEIIYD